MARSPATKAISPSYSSYRVPFHEQPIFHYALAILVIISLAVSLVALVNSYQLKKTLMPKTVSIDEFLKKLTAHTEMKAYLGVAPLNIIQINSNNLANLQAQISGLDTTFLGNYIVQYTDRIVLYDFDNDKLKGNAGLQQPQETQLPDGFFAKINAHDELQGLQSEQPIIGQLDKASLDTLKQQFPEVYANAQIGDYLVRYKTKLVIYDYANDKIVNSVDLK